jgi:hypothetical protein
MASGGDQDTLALTLSQFVACPSCASAVLLALVDLCVELQDEHEHDWQQRMAAALLAHFDSKAAS